MKHSCSLKLGLQSSGPLILNMILTSHGTMAIGYTRVQQESNLKENLNKINISQFIDEGLNDSDLDDILDDEEKNKEQHHSKKRCPHKRQRKSICDTSEFSFSRRGSSESGADTLNRSLCLPSSLMPIIRSSRRGEYGGRRCRMLSRPVRLAR